MEQPPIIYLLFFSVIFQTNNMWCQFYRFYEMHLLRLCFKSVSLFYGQLLVSLRPRCPALVLHSGFVNCMYFIEKIKWMNVSSAAIPRHRWPLPAWIRVLPTSSCARVPATLSTARRPWRKCRLRSPPVGSAETARLHYHSHTFGTLYTQLHGFICLLAV